MKEIRPLSNLNTTIALPGSKSITHRAFVIAALALGQSRIEDALICDDTMYTLNGLKQLGVQIEQTPEAIIINGVNGRPVPEKPVTEIYLGNSGTSLRFLASFATLARKEVILTGDERLQQRPMEDLLMVLKNGTAQVDFKGEEWHAPVSIKGPFRGGLVKIPGHNSSQFVSSLLLISPCIPYGMEIVVQNVPVSISYISLTLDVMRSFGMSYRASDDCRWFRISPQPYRGRTYKVGVDASSAAYFWAAAAVTGGRVKTPNINPDSKQADMGFLKVLEEMGCKVEWDDTGVAVQGGELHGIEVDMANMPDQVPTLAVIALFAKGKTVISNVSHLRTKESDRLAVSAQEIAKTGGKITELDDGLVIEGGTPLNGAEIDPHNDHRIAMSMAVAGLMTEGIKINNEECVTKSLPNFWELWEELYR